MVFGSTCTVHCDARNKSLGYQGKAAIIIGMGSETKGYNLYIPMDKVVVVSQHAQNIKTLSSDEDQKLKTCLQAADPQEETRDQVQKNAKGRNKKDAIGLQSGWTLARHLTRSTKQTRNENLAEDPNVANAVIMQDTRNYGEAIGATTKISGRMRKLKSWML